MNDYNEKFDITIRAAFYKKKINFLDKTIEY